MPVSCRRELQFNTTAVVAKLVLVASAYADKACRYASSAQQIKLEALDHAAVSATFPRAFDIDTCSRTSTHSCACAIRGSRQPPARSCNSYTTFTAWATCGGLNRLPAGAACSRKVVSAGSNARLADQESRVHSGTSTHRNARGPYHGCARRAEGGLGGSRACDHSCDLFIH